MEVIHFEIRKAHGQFELIFHSIDDRGRKSEILATEGRSVSMWQLIDRCTLNGEFRSLQRNAK